MKTLIVAATICLPLLAGAQVLELTPDTACGAPGVGLVRSFASGAETWRAEARDGKPGQRVGRDGRWHAGCQMPPACQERAIYPWADQASGRVCRAPAGVTRIRAAAAVGKLAQVHAIGPGGSIVGRLSLRCTEDGRWTVDQAETYCRGQ